MNRTSLFIAAITCVIAVSAGSVSSAGPLQPQDQQATPDTIDAPKADSMMGALQKVLGSLSPEQMNLIGYNFDDPERTQWFYTPVDRVGAPVGRRDDLAIEGVIELLRTGLGERGSTLARDIISLEEVLFANSGGAAMREPGNYFLVTFGIPSTEGPWGWRFEGHHLSVNFTVIDDRIVSATPAFFGGSPARVPEDDGTHPGLAPFSREEELGRALVGTFEGAQATAVVINAEAPQDVLTTNTVTADMGPPEGIAYGDMSAEQQTAMTELLTLYASRMNKAVADYQLAKINQAGMERVHFAWAGSTAAGEAHYYRIHGPTFVVEYDNTQNNANHVHSVWRDFDDDFGADPLRQHLAADHGLEIEADHNKATSHLGSSVEIGDDRRAHQRAHATGTPHSHAHR